MIPLIPEEQYNELTSNISEASEIKKFSIDDFEDFIKNEINTSAKFDEKGVYEIISYLKGTNVKYIGQGSSRISFFIPSGSLIDSSAPCCLKIAKNIAGCAQSLAEIKLFNSHKYECFPKLFEYDSTGKYMITEIAKKLSDRYMKIYAGEWNENVLNLNSHSKCLIDTSFDDTTEAIMELVKQFNRETSEKLKYFIDDLYNNICNKIIIPITNQNKKFTSLKSLIEFSKNVGWNEVMPNDLEFNENWGLVTRNKINMPIPVDWGFTKEVSEKYY